ncbi:hypothetical protein [Kribbella sp. NPDC049227]|uniref:hypothetical protein n=1 Tax=Kribbella sp. NPDC049227 TaxID=3364113 RepID=UPI0037182109
MATEIETHASNLLEALYKAHQADADQDAAVDSYLEEAGLDPVQAGFDLVDFLADRGLVAAHHTAGTPRGWITPDGIHAVQSLHAKRADPKVRAALLRAEMLQWLDRREDDGQEPASFQEFVDALTENSEMFSERELRGAADYLHHNDLIDAVHVEESTDGWIHPRLTPHGREYITDHGGDVAEFLRERRGGSSTTHHSTTVHISDNNGNLVIHGDRFTQNYNAGINVEDLVKFAGGVRQMLPVLGIDQAAQDDLAAVADDLHAEATSVTPDRGRLRQLVNRLLAGVNAAAPTVAKTMLLAAAEAAQKAITG